MTTAKPLDVLTDMAEPRLVRKATLDVSRGTHTWVVDPTNRHCVGLCRTGTTQADIIVYTDIEDFEVSDDWS